MENKILLIYLAVASKLFVYDIFLFFSIFFFRNNIKRLSKINSCCYLISNSSSFLKKIKLFKEEHIHNNLAIEKKGVYS